MDETISYKAALTYAAAALTNYNSESIDLTGNVLVLVTPAGTISGTFVSKELEKELENDAGFILMNSITKQALNVCNQPLQTILLTNATLINTGITQHFKFLHVFVDDIIAVTFSQITIDN